jgi:hypothetical protein
LAEQARQWRIKNPVRRRINRRSYDLKKKYGLSLEQFENMLNAQGGVCAICRKKTVRMAVDHCHKTGKIRGILCIQCNPGLGKFFDSPDLCRRAAEYLERHQNLLLDKSSSGATFPLS